VFSDDMGTKWNKLKTSIFEICPVDTVVGCDYSGSSLKA